MKRGLQILGFLVKCFFMSGIWLPPLFLYLWQITFPLFLWFIFSGVFIYLLVAGVGGWKYLDGLLAPYKLLRALVYAGLLAVGIFVFFFFYIEDTTFYWDL